MKCCSVFGKPSWEANVSASGFVLIIFQVVLVTLKKPETAEKCEKGLIYTKKVIVPLF